MVPSITCAVLAGLIVVAVARTGTSTARAMALAGSWATILAGAMITDGPAALGSVLAGAFVLQVVPSLHAAAAASSTVGVSRPTWVMIGVEVACWRTIGVLDARPPLMFLGTSGLAPVAAMLWRTRPGRKTPADGYDPHADVIGLSADVAEEGTAISVDTVNPVDVD